MSRIYSTFSNPGGDLQSVKDEFADILNFFNDDDVKKKVDYSFVLNEKVDKITSQIVAGQKDIRLFHFSGHSAGSGLDFPEEEFDVEHLTDFFNTISSDSSKIECVFLNGCENATIVERLSNVPVVIGTRSKIQDSVAHKFTKDFFGSLVESKSSYKQSFMDAVSAQSNLQISIFDRTRGVVTDAEPEVELNDYFLVVNDKKVADSSFPFKKVGHNWTKYLVLLFVVVALILGYLFRDSIFKSVAGYTCDPIQTESDKCNFVIAEFTTDQTIDFNTWLYNNIRESDVIKTYLHAINLGTFEKAIRNNSVDRDSLPQLCDYDFNLTGSVTAEQQKLRADFSIFPFDPESASTKTFTYHVGSLGGLDTLITYLDPDKANQFVLFELCVACALQKDMQFIMPVLQELIQDYAFGEETAESYQRMQYRMSEVALRYSDTTLALKSLDAIASTSNNDFVLKALEKQTVLYQAQGDVKNVYKTQSRYLKEVELRGTNPSEYELKKKPTQYTRAADRVRLDRASLVLKHKDDALLEYRPEAVRDFERLDDIKFQQKEYSDQIQILNARLINPGIIGDLQVDPSALNPGTIRPVDPSMVEVTQRIPVILSGYKVRERDFAKLLSQLKESGYAVDSERSSILERLPRNIAQKPSVFYTTAGSAELAKKIALQVSRFTSLRFNALPAETDNRLTHARELPNEIRIYWPGQALD